MLSHLPFLWFFLFSSRYCYNSEFFLSAPRIPAVGVKGRVESVEVSLIQMILDNAEGFTETLEVNHLSGPQEANGVGYIRGIYGETQNVVVGGTCLFLCCHILRQIRNGISHRLEHCRRKGVPEAA